MKERITVLDILITVLIIALSVIISYSVFDENGNSYIRVQSPDGVYLYPISEDARYKFNGKIGESVIEVDKGQVSFVSSPCPNKTCITDGSISKAGEFLACLPNGISVTITGKGGVDDVSF